MSLVSAAVEISIKYDDFDRIEFTKSTPEPPPRYSITIQLSASFLNPYSDTGSNQTDLSIACTP